MIRKIFHTSEAPTIIPRMIVGLVFLSEGLQKFIIPEAVGAGRFAKIGFEHPEFWSSFVAVFEITCSLMILPGLITRIASFPLLIIMLVAFVTTKYPILVEKGFFAMAHEYRTDFAMTMLLLFLLYYGGGKYSLDKRYFNKT